MRLISIGLLAVVLLSAAVLTVQKPMPLTVGFGPATGSSSYTMTNSGGTSALGAFSFVAPSSPFGGTMRLKDVRIITGTQTGSPKLTAALYSDSNGLPGSVIETGTESGVLTNGVWYSLGGFTSTSNLTAGTQYWVVLRCSSGTSSTVALQYLSSGAYGHPPTSSGAGGSGQAWGMTAVASTDNGSTWSTAWRYSVIGLRIGITDGTDDAYFGLPVGAFAGAIAASEKLYTNSGSAQEVGSYFTTPANATLNVRGVMMFVKRNSSPSGNVRFRLYSGTYTSLTLLATTAAIPGGNITTSTGSLYTSYFPSTISVAGGTKLSVTAGNTAADDSTNCFNTNKWPVDSDTDSLALLPFAGMQSIKYSGGAWSVTSGEAVPFWLLLDTDGEFEAPEGGGGEGGQSGWIYQQ